MSSTTITDGRDTELRSGDRTSISVKIPASGHHRGPRSHGTHTPESRVSLPPSLDFPGSECGTQGPQTSYKNSNKNTMSESESLRNGAINEKE